MLTRRVVAGSLAIATSFGLLATATSPASAAPKPPVPPKAVPITSQSAVDSARSNRDSVAAQVGAISAQIAEMDRQLQLLEHKKELAEQKYALAMSQLQQSVQRRDAATARVVQCRQAADSAHDDFVRGIQASYESGQIDGLAGTMLTVDDPTALLNRGALENYLARNKADTVGRYQALLIRCSNAEAAAKRDVQAWKKAVKAANDAKQAAFAAVAQARQQEQALATQRAAKQNELEQKQALFYTTAASRRQYLTYVQAKHKYQQEKATYDAWVEEQARLRAERLARQRARHHGNGGGGGGGGGGSWSPGPSAPSGGGWTAAKGRQAVHRAMSQLGMPYAWAGGGVGGPSWGVCDGSNGAPNDCNVRGFDCSGLVMYAWGKNWAHYAATQYGQAGSYHPSLDNLRPGDLLFWSDGGVWAIHHVAIYIGGGQIIQAPESGSYVMISSMYAPGPIFGATRPLT